MSEIENLKTTIATLQQQLEKLEAEQKAKKWEPKAGKFSASTDGKVHAANNSDADISYGIERDTKEAAEERYREMRRFSRLLAYHNEFVVPPFHKPFAEGTSNTYIGFSHATGKFEGLKLRTVEVFGVPNFPPEIAKALIEKLNSGEVEF